MRDPDRALACRNCRRSLPAHRMDRSRWCDVCRREVVRRASRVARVVAALGTLAVAAWAATLIGTAPRFLVGWLVLLGAVWYFLYKLTQRVAFEVIRGRGVPPPEE